jgi:hypothetical protein
VLVAETCGDAVVGTAERQEESPAIAISKLNSKILGGFMGHICMIIPELKNQGAAGAAS